MQAFDFGLLLAFLEIFRRSVWILLRVEWECTNNSATVATDSFGGFSVGTTAIPSNTRREGVELPSRLPASDVDATVAARSLL